MSIISAKKILVVDDDTDLLEIMKFLLADAGYKVRTCETGKQILNTIKKFKPDLVILDIILGNLDGRNLCRAIKTDKHTKLIPVIIISAVDDLDDITLTVGTNGILSKPFDIDSLLSCIRKQLPA
jgi:DNA-binding response OmpR family regulator